MEPEYQEINACQLCGKRFWKGYFILAPSEVTNFEVTQVVCFRCKFLKPAKKAGEKAQA